MEAHERSSLLQLWQIRLYSSFPGLLQRYGAPNFDLIFGSILPFQHEVRASSAKIVQGRLLGRRRSRWRSAQAVTRNRNPRLHRFILTPHLKRHFSYVIRHVLRKRENVIRHVLRKREKSVGFRATRGIVQQRWRVRANTLRVRRMLEKIRHGRAVLTQARNTNNFSRNLRMTRQSRKPQMCSEADPRMCAVIKV